MLLGSGLALIGAGLSGKTAFTGLADTKVVRPFRISLNTSTISGYKLPVEQQIEECAEAEFDGIELWVSDVEQYIRQGGTYPALADRIKSSGLVLENMIGFAPWIVGGKGMDQMKREMESAAILGSQCVAATALGIDQVDRNQLDSYAARYRQLLEYGEEVGVRPLLEVWGAGALNQLSDAMHISLGSQHPQATMLLDFFHLYRGNNSFDSLPLINGARLPVFHMNDYPVNPSRIQQGDADRVYPGDGICPFDKILPSLYESGFRGAFSLELFNPSYWAEPDHKKALRTGYRKVADTIDKAMRNNV